MTCVQPPKNKGTSKKPAKARTDTLIDGLTKDEMSKEQVSAEVLSGLKVWVNACVCFIISKERFTVPLN